MEERVAQAASVQDYMVRQRRHLHRHPEVGLELPETHAYLDRELRSMGLYPEVRGAAGVAVKISGQVPDGTTSVLRADMDALPVTEATGLPFASVREGAMHACGHDLHMAMLLGATVVLVDHPPRRDTVLVFQPGEESDRGAVRALQHPLLESLSVATAFAIHVHATLPAHSINHRQGVFMGYGDWFVVDFQGPGGHASQPHLVGNPVEAGARFVLDAKRLVERLALDEHLVATVTESVIGNTVNVIPAEGRLRGTIRTLSVEQRIRLIQGLTDLAAVAAEQTRTRARFELVEGYPAVVNDDGYVAEFVEAVERTSLGSHLVDMPEPSMVIEDFAYFLGKWPGAMVYLGANIPGHESFNHANDADYDEGVLSTGAALFLMAADGFAPLST